MDILIIKLGAIGDVIRTTAVLQGLKSKYKSCRIGWVTDKESIDVLKDNGLIDEIHLIGKSAKNLLKKKEYDLVISLDDDYGACELASEVNSKKIIGSHLENSRKTYTDDSSLWFDMGLISKFGKQKADVLKAENKSTYQAIMYSILGLYYKKQEPILVLGRKSLQFAEKFIKKNKLRKSDLIIGINAGAGGRWEDKKLSIGKTAELIYKLNKQIKNKNIKIILFGGPEEKERNERIKSLVKTEIIDAGCSNSLMEFASLINLCKVLVTSDSLALHIGVALKKKIAVWFYPTSANEIELYNRGIKIIWEGRSYCSYQAKCEYPPKIEIEKIINAVRELV